MEKIHLTYINVNNPKYFRNVTIYKKWGTKKKIKIKYKFKPKKVKKILKNIVRITRINPTMYGIISSNGISLIDNKTIQNKKIQKKLVKYKLKDLKEDLYYNPNYNLQNEYRFFNKDRLSTDEVIKLLKIFEQKIIVGDLGFLDKLYQILFNGSQIYIDIEPVKIEKELKKL